MQSKGIFQEAGALTSCHSVTEMRAQRYTSTQIKTDDRFTIVTDISLPPKAPTSSSPRSFS
jgi:hypothetical protein